MGFWETQERDIVLSQYNLVHFIRNSVRDADISLARAYFSESLHFLQEEKGLDLEESFSQLEQYCRIADSMIRTTNGKNRSFTHAFNLNNAGPAQIMYHQFRTEMSSTQYLLSTN